MMTYRLYFTDVEVSKVSYEAQKARLTTYVYHELDDALGMAREITERGGVSWEIESDDGTLIGRYAIARLLRDRAAELVGHPKVR